MMTGSFYISRFCHIRYLLKAVLIHPTSEKDNQIYEMFLNVLEPPRMPLDRVQLSNTVESKCCGCCISYGTMTATMMCDKNFVRSGDSISVKGIIDNTRGKKKVDSASVVFQQCLFEIASNQYNTHLTVEKQFTLHRFTTPTQVGQMQQFSFTANIPNQVVDCTAIGRIVSRYFVLYLDTEYGCCSNTVDSAIHLIVHSRSPVIVEKKAITPPPGWNPTVYPRVQCPPMKPYIYTPLPQIPFLNLPGQNTISISNMQSEMNLMQKNIGYEIGKQIAFKKQKYDYQPQYYNQDMFSRQQQAQQGYQPYFINQPDSQQVLKDK